MSALLDKAMRSGLGYLVPPVATIAVVLCAMALSGMVPFGDHAMLYDDATIQYVGFFGWYHEVLNGNADLFYSFAKSLGGSTFTLFAYYLASPFNLLLYFFDAESVPLYVSILIPVKLGLAALSCYAYVRHRLGCYGLPYALLSCAYALAACNLESGSNFMWLDGVILLPLAALAVHRVVKTGSPLMLSVVVAACVISNWYAGYMLCMASVGFFFVEVFLAKPGAKGFLKRGLAFAGAMVLGIGISMPLFLPVIIEMLNAGGISDSGFVHTLKDFSLYPEGLSDVLESLYMGTDTTPFLTKWGIRPANFPMASLLLLLPTAYFFVKVEGHGRHKALFAFALCFMLLCVLLKPLDMVWTGFTRSDSYNPRYMFVIVFMLVAMSAQCVRTLSNVGRREAFSAAAKAFAALAVVAVVLVLDGWRPHLKVLALQCALLALMAWALVRTVRTEAYRGKMLFAMAAPLVLTLAFFAESGYLQKHQMDAHFSGTSVAAYSSYLSELSQVCPDYHETGFYRLGNAVSDSRGALLSGANSAPTGENMALGIPGLSHYSSSGEQSVNDLLGGLGYCLTPGTRAITYYRSPLYLTDSILGMDRIIDDGTPFGCEKEADLDSHGTPTVGRALYNNPAALSVGFGAPGDLETFEWGRDPFENQEAWVGGLAGVSGDYYIPADMSAGDEGQPAATWRVTARESGPLYLFVDSPSPVSVLIDGAPVQSAGNWEFDTNVIYVGEFTAGQTVDVSLEGLPAAEASKVFIQAETLNVPLAQEALDVLSRDQLEVEEFSDGKIAGTFDASRDETLVLTVPYREEWSATVDGEAVELQNYQGLMCLSLAQGQHSVEITFGTTKGILPGCVIAALSAAMLIAWISARAVLAGRRR